MEVFEVSPDEIPPPIHNFLQNSVDTLFIVPQYLGL